jgi:hypothetical protein
MELGMHPAILYPRRSQIRPLMVAQTQLQLYAIALDTGFGAPPLEAQPGPKGPGLRLGMLNAGGRLRLIVEQPPC